MTAAQGIIRPEKPYPEFPLYPHGSGVWAKKFRGTTYYLGPWVDHEGALAEWHRIRDEIELGIVSSAVTGRVDVDYMVNAFLASKKAQVDAGDLRLCTFQQYKLACKWLKENMGAHRVIENVGPADFMRLRSKFDPKWSATTIKNQVNLVRTIFKWAYENDLIDKPVKYGTNFSRPSAKRRNLEKASKPPKDFAASEIWTLLDASSMRLRAWLLLGLNCGYGNSDLSRLKVSDVSGEWLREARGKTGLDRKAWLWPETREALREVLKDHKGGDLMFTTRYGLSLVSEDGSRDAVACEFGKLKRFCGIHRKGVGYYSIRHVCQTVGDEALDPVATKTVMGHEHDDGSSGEYRSWISDNRVKKVCQRVRKWFLDGEPKKKRRGVA